MRLRLTLPLLALLAIPPPAPAGNILYEFADINYPHSAIARMEVAEAALGRGYFTNSDLLGFGFNLFGAANLDPFMLPIDLDGSPAGGGRITGSRVFLGSNYRLTVDFPAGFYQVTTLGSRGVYGDGYWTATIQPSASVPEPSSFTLAGVAAITAACVVLARRIRHHHEGTRRWM